LISRRGALSDRDLISGRHGDGATRVRRHLQRAFVDLIGRLRSTRRKLLDEREEPCAADHSNSARRPHLITRIRSLQLLDRRPRAPEGLLDGHLDPLRGDPIQRDHLDLRPGIDRQGRAVEEREDGASVDVRANEVARRVDLAVKRRHERGSGARAFDRLVQDGECRRVGRRRGRSATREIEERPRNADDQQEYDE
jgi:hypothetical protein